MMPCDLPEEPERPALPLVAAFDGQNWEASIHTLR
jgi:hypothetical protein